MVDAGVWGCQPLIRFKNMESNKIWHNSAINMMTVGVALTLLKIPELWIQDDLLCEGQLA